MIMNPGWIGEINNECCVVLDVVKEWLDFSPQKDIVQKQTRAVSVAVLMRSSSSALGAFTS